MKKSEDPHLGFIARKNTKGRGAFATHAFRRGQVIGVMQGRILPEGRVLVQHRQKHLVHIEQAYTDPLQIGPKRYMALAKPWLYLNHSCDPNVGIRGVATLFALRSIKPGDELTLDYSTTMDELFICRCGAKNCRGVAADFFALPKAVQVHYVRKGAVPGFILKKYRRLITRR